jgi:hypothetical protein
MPELDIVARLKLAGEQFSSEFDTRMKRIEDTARSTSSRVNSALAGLSTATKGIAAGVGVATLATLAQRSLDYASSLGETAQQLGVTTRDLQVYRYAASQVGVEQDAMDRSLAKLTQTLGKAALGAKGPLEAFQALGINVRDASGHVLTAGEAIPKIADALENVRDPAQRAAAEVALFGKAGQQLDTLLAGGSGQVGELALAAERLGIVLSDKQIQAADDTADKIASLKQVLEANVSKVVADNATAIYGYADSLTKLAASIPDALNRLEVLKTYFNEQEGRAYEGPGRLLSFVTGGRLGTGLVQRAQAEQAEARLRRFDLSIGWTPDSLRRAAPAATKPTIDRDLPNFLDTVTDKTNKLTEAQRKAAAAQREMLATFDRVRDEGDPEAALFRDYKAQTDAIRDAVAKGLRTEEEGAAAGRGAMDAYFDGLRKVADERQSEIEDILSGWFTADPVDAQGFFDRNKASLDRALGIASPKNQNGSNYRAVSETLESIGGLRIGSGASRALSLLGGSAGSNDDPFQQGIASVLSPLEKAVTKNTLVLGSSAERTKKLQEALGSVAGAAAVGGLSGGVFASITGGKNNQLASSVGGALGQFAGKELGKSFGTALGSFSSLAGPLGSIAGGILGNLAGGLFSSTKKGSTTLAYDGFGNIVAGATSGNSASRQAASAASAGSVGSAIAQIAAALGGTVTGAGTVSIGMRNDSYRVDTLGLGRTKAATSVLSFKTEQEAIRAAISDLLRDGVVGGISDASRRILQSGKDLENAITKASLIEAIPRDLKAMLDPVGAAIDDLNRKWADTAAALKEGGASAEQLAQAEKLHSLQLDQIKASTASASASLKDFRDSLKLGSSSPYSLRDQEATALAGLQPYLDAIAAGGAIDQQKYQEAAQSFLEVERQLYGSTSAYFDKLDMIQAATNKAISAIDNAVPITPAVADPFAKATATNTATSNELLAQMSEQMQQLQQTMAQVATNTGATGGSAFIGQDRQYR